MNFADAKCYDFAFGKNCASMRRGAALTAIYNMQFSTACLLFPHPLICDRPVEKIGRGRQSTEKLWISTAFLCGESVEHPKNPGTRRAARKRLWISPKFSTACKQACRQTFNTPDRGQISLQNGFPEFSTVCTGSTASSTVS